MKLQPWMIVAAIIVSIIVGIIIDYQVINSDMPTFWKIYFLK